MRVASIKNFDRREDETGEGSLDVALLRILWG
jgi:hypothetical protein